jgi:hypothetical protein
MPAVSLLTMKTDYLSNRNGQAALLKLWLLLTAVPETTSGGAPPVFYKQADIDTFTAKQSTIETPAYYLDMTAIGTNDSPVGPLLQTDVDGVFGLLANSGARSGFHAVASAFQAQGALTLGYPHSGCTTPARIFSVQPNGTDPDQ